MFHDQIDGVRFAFEGKLDVGPPPVPRRNGRIRVRSEIPRGRTSEATSFSKRFPGPGRCTAGCAARAVIHVHHRVFRSKRYFESRLEAAFFGEQMQGCADVLHKPRRLVLKSSHSKIVPVGGVRRGQPFGGYGRADANGIGVFGGRVVQLQFEAEKGWLPRLLPRSKGCLPQTVCAVSVAKGQVSAHPAAGYRKLFGVFQSPFFDFFLVFGNIRCFCHRLSS